MDEAGFEFAQALADNERADAILAAQRSLQGLGSDECESCGEVIPPDRRRAAPFATRCMPCQSAVEHQRRIFQPLSGLPR